MEVLAIFYLAIATVVAGNLLDGGMNGFSGILVATLAGLTWPIWVGYLLFLSIRQARKYSHKR
jgi:hypothetical protein